MNSGRVGRFGRLVGSDFQTGGSMKPKERSPIDFKLRSGIFRNFSPEDLKVRGVCYVQTGRQAGNSRQVER